MPSNFLNATEDFANPNWTTVDNESRTVDVQEKGYGLWAHKYRITHYIKDNRLTVVRLDSRGRNRGEEVSFTDVPTQNGKKHRTRKWIAKRVLTHGNLLTDKEKGELLAKEGCTNDATLLLDWMSDHTLSGQQPRFESRQPQTAGLKSKRAKTVLGSMIKNDTDTALKILFSKPVSFQADVLTHQLTHPPYVKNDTDKLLSGLLQRPDDHVQQILALLIEEAKNCEQNETETINCAVKGFIDCDPLQFSKILKTADQELLTFVMLLAAKKPSSEKTEYFLNLLFNAQKPDNLIPASKAVSDFATKSERTVYESDLQTLDAKDLAQSWCLVIDSELQTPQPKSTNAELELLTRLQLDTSDDCLQVILKAQCELPTELGEDRLSDVNNHICLLSNTQQWQFLKDSLKYQSALTEFNKNLITLILEKNAQNYQALCKQLFDAEQLDVFLNLYECLPELATSLFKQQQLETQRSITVHLLENQAPDSRCFQIITKLLKETGEELNALKQNLLTDNTSLHCLQNLIEKDNPLAVELIRYQSPKRQATLMIKLLMETDEVSENCLSCATDVLINNDATVCEALSNPTNFCALIDKLLVELPPVQVIYFSSRLFKKLANPEATTHEKLCRLLFNPNNTKLFLQVFEHHHDIAEELFLQQQAKDITLTSVKILADCSANSFVFQLIKRTLIKNTAFGTELKKGVYSASLNLSQLIAKDVQVAVAIIKSQPPETQAECIKEISTPISKLEGDIYKCVSELLVWSSDYTHVDICNALAKLSDFDSFIEKILPLDSDLAETIVNWLGIDLQIHWLNKAFEQTPPSTKAITIIKSFLRENNSNYDALRQHVVQQKFHLSLISIDVELAAQICKHQTPDWIAEQVASLVTQKGDIPAPIIDFIGAVLTPESKVHVFAALSELESNANIFKSLYKMNQALVTDSLSQIDIPQRLQILLSLSESYQAGSEEAAAIFKLLCTSEIIDTLAAQHKPYTQQQKLVLELILTKPELNAIHYVANKHRALLTRTANDFKPNVKATFLAELNRSGGQEFLFTQIILSICSDNKPQAHEVLAQLTTQISVTELVSCITPSGQLIQLIKYMNINLRRQIANLTSGVSVDIFVELLRPAHSQQSQPEIDLLTRWQPPISISMCKNLFGCGRNVSPAIQKHLINLLSCHSDEIIGQLFSSTLSISQLAALLNSIHVQNGIEKKRYSIFCYCQH